MVIASNFQYIHQLSRSAHMPNYNCIKHQLLPYCKLIEHSSYTVDLWICMCDDASHSWTEMFLCHSIKISISLVCLNQSSPFFHHCKVKSMPYLEMDIIFSRFLLFFKYSPHQMIACSFFFFFFLTHPVQVYYTSLITCIFWKLFCLSQTIWCIMQLAAQNWNADWSLTALRDLQSTHIHWLLPFHLISDNPCGIFEKNSP